MWQVRLWNASLALGWFDALPASAFVSGRWAPNRQPGGHRTDRVPPSFGEVNGGTMYYRCPHAQPTLDAWAREMATTSADGHDQMALRIALYERREHFAPAPDFVCRDYKGDDSTQLMLEKARAGGCAILHSHNQQLFVQQPPPPSPPPPPPQPPPPSPPPAHAGSSASIAASGVRAPGIFVLGVSRSGTSIFTSLLRALGAHLGGAERGRLGGAGSGAHPDGINELPSAAALNKAIFAAHGALEPSPSSITPQLHAHASLSAAQATTDVLTRPRRAHCMQA